MGPNVNNYRRSLFFEDEVGNDFIDKYGSLVYDDAAYPINDSDFVEYTSTKERKARGNYDRRLDADYLTTPDVTSAGYDESRGQYYESMSRYADGGQDVRRRSAPELDTIDISLANELRNDTPEKMLRYRSRYTTFPNSYGDHSDAVYSGNLTFSAEEMRHFARNPNLTELSDNDREIRENEKFAPRYGNLKHDEPDHVLSSEPLNIRDRKTNVEHVNYSVNRNDDGDGLVEIPTETSEVVSTEYEDSKRVDEEQNVQSEESPLYTDEAIIATGDMFKPYSIDQIQERVYVQMTEEKGRCLYVRHKSEPGDVIFVEKPVLVAIPSLDPELWAKLLEVNEEKELNLPPIWHLAAICSLTMLNRSDQEIVLNKWTPHTNMEPSSDVLRVMAKTNVRVNASKLERCLQAWRYNSFGHHTENDGLVLYNQISYMAHNCNSSSCWHYGEENSFVLRAKKKLEAGEELTISYIGEEDLLKSTHIRREKLSGWLFNCMCARCSLKVDSSRGFRCPYCGTGTFYMKTEHDGKIITTKCATCSAQITEQDITTFMDFEDAYAARLEEMSSDDAKDVELVYYGAQGIFTQHWIIYALRTMLFEDAKTNNRFTEAEAHQRERIDFIFEVLPSASFTVAWALEEAASIICQRISPNFHENEPIDATISAFDRTRLLRDYEDAVNMLTILCGDNHDYTLNAWNKYLRVSDLCGLNTTNGEES